MSDNHVTVVVFEDERLLHCCSSSSPSSKKNKKKNRHDEDGHDTKKRSSVWKRLFSSKKKSSLSCSKRNSLTTRTVGTSTSILLDGESFLKSERDGGWGSSPSSTNHTNHYCDSSDDYQDDTATTTSRDDAAPPVDFRHDEDVDDDDDADEEVYSDRHLFLSGEFPRWEQEETRDEVAPNSTATPDEEEPSEYSCCCCSSSDDALLLEQAQAARKNGDLVESLELYERLCRRANRRHSVCGLGSNEPATSTALANFSFICARLALQVNRPHVALRYGKFELDFVTSQKQNVVAEAACYHQLANICQDGLGDLEQALQYYQLALQVEQSPRYAHALQANPEEVASNIQESRECIGRIQFALGNVEEALRML